MSVFKPPTDWEAVYAAKPNEYTFGEEPSQLARSALRFFQAFGGDPAQSLALDLGCGEGRDTAFLAGAGFRVQSRDVAPTGLEKTRALLERQNVPAERVDLALGDVRAFEYPAETYDVALAANVFQFLTPDEGPGHIACLQTATKPGGICAVGVFSPAMLAWGAEIDGHFTATADDLMARFSPQQGWRLLDRTEYWTYRMADAVMASFAFVVARKALS